MRDKEGGWTTKTFEKEGPANVIVTTTAINLHNENETRMLSLQTNDSAEQTSRVLEALAAEASDEIDYRRWHELHRWLRQQSNVVTIPFARALAKQVPPVAVRLRRDFGSLLSLIRAHALLHQASRERTEHGHVVATWADYLAVRALVLDVMSEGLGATVSQTVRDTVDAVAVLTATATATSGVTAAAVGRKLGLDPSAARRRLLAAAADGYVVNEQERPRAPGRYVVGEPLPDDVEVLPTFLDEEPESAGQGDDGTMAGIPEGEDTPCPECGAKSAEPGYHGHANGCSRFRGKADA